MGQDKPNERESGAESSRSLLTPPTTDPGEGTHASRSGTSPPPTNPPSYFERGQPGYSEPLPRVRTQSFRAPGFNPRPQPRVKRPSSTPLRNPRRTSVHRPPHGHGTRASSHQALQVGNDVDETDVGELDPGLQIGNGDTQPNNTHVRTRPPLSFGPPIASQQPSGSSDAISTASVPAASQVRGQTRASRTTSSVSPESVPTRASHTSPYEQQEPDEPVTQDGHRGPAVTKSETTYLARQREELRNKRHTNDHRGHHKCQMDRTVPATNGVSRRPSDSYADQGDRPSYARGQYERSADIPQPRSGISSTVLSLQSASKRPRSGHSSPTDQPVTQRPRTSVTEPFHDNQLRPQGVGGPSPPQSRTSVAPSASFSLATISRRTNLAASSTPDPATRTSPPRTVDVSPPRASNVTPPNPRQSTSTARPNSTDVGHHRSSLATPPRPTLSTNASLSNGPGIDTRQTRTPTPRVPRSSSIGSASPATTNTTLNSIRTRSTSLSSRPNSYKNAPNDQRSSTPASSESPPSQTHTTNTRPPPIRDEGFDYWSLTPHQRTTYRPNHTPYLIASLRSGVQGSLPNTDPSRPFRENNPEDPRIEFITNALHVTRAEAVGITLGQDEIRKQVKEKATTTKTPATVDTDAHATPLKRPGTERRFRLEMARLHTPSNESRRNASQPPSTSPATGRPRPRSHTIAAPGQQGANEDDDDDEAEDSRSRKGKREERHFRCRLPADPIAPFRRPFGFSKSLLCAGRDEKDSVHYKSLHPFKDFMGKGSGFRTMAQYDALCKSLYQECKRGRSAMPHRDSGRPGRGGSCLWSRKGKSILCLSVLLCLLLVYGGAVVAAALVLLVRVLFLRSRWIR